MSSKTIPISIILIFLFVFNMSAKNYNPPTYGHNYGNDITNSKDELSQLPPKYIVLEVSYMYSPKAKTDKNMSDLQFDAEISEEQVDKDILLPQKNYSSDVFDIDAIDGQLRIFVVLTLSDGSSISDFGKKGLFNAIKYKTVVENSFHSLKDKLAEEFLILS